ncbi:hypothetical protein B0T10DRAFT_66731 [Thelonectria olida]|uniref:Uncharacterized protein n=1 Tax=Thelonectria olida TaxID=1576542 RepID=A0A9P8W1U1_9HYPO|nr:hypothetical protein B0T10DRAFT_66731 [Thelonectria olida]
MQSSYSSESAPSAVGSLCKKCLGSSGCGCGQRERGSTAGSPGRAREARGGVNERNLVEDSCGAGGQLSWSLLRSREESEARWLRRDGNFEKTLAFGGLACLRSSCCTCCCHPCAGCTDIHATCANKQGTKRRYAPRGQLKDTPVRDGEQRYPRRAPTQGSGRRKKRFNRANPTEPCSCGDRRLVVLGGLGETTGALHFSIGAVGLGLLHCHFRLDTSTRPGRRFCHWPDRLLRAVDGVCRGMLGAMLPDYSCD